MIRLNRDGFTLIELLAVLLLLAIIMGIGSYSIIGVLNDSREKNYNLLIENIRSAVEQYRIECKYSSGTSINCPSENSGEYVIELNDLVKYGFLKGNSDDSNDAMGLFNPKDNVKINNCKIKYSYRDGKINILAINADETNSCPTSY